jgi:hypothetical protein
MATVDEKVQATPQSTTSPPLTEHTPESQTLESAGALQNGNLKDFE